MVRELERPQSKTKFPETAPTAYPVFYRTYSRRTPDGKETWKEVCDRTIGGLKKLGQLTDEEADLLYRMQGQLKSLSSGRWLWVGGTEWIEQQENFSGAYNCSSTNVIDWETFGLLMDLAMMGCGTGAVLEPRYINKLPPIKNRLKVLLVGKIGSTPKEKRREYSEVKVEEAENTATIYVGDSRQGWVGSYKALLELSTDDRFNGEVEVAIDLSDVRPAGEPLKGFGGVANPVKLPSLYQKCAGIINKAVGRQLSSLECCLLIDEAAACIVAGNIRRCIAGGTLVAAVDGMKPIEEVKVGDRVLTSSGEYRPVVNKFVQGTQEVVQIRTPATSILCTANHRVAVYNGLRSYTWKQAGQLQPGDRLISVPHERGSDSVNIDYAWVLGFLWKSLVEASVPRVTQSRKATATFSLPKGRLQSKLGEKCLAVLKLIGDTPTVSYNGNRGYIRIYRNDFASDFVESQEPNGDRQIPQSIWQGTAEIRASFLAGLSDADGMPGRNILLHSNELDFNRQVQKLALSLGIATTLSERRPQELKRPKGNKKFPAGDHLVKIQGMQSEAIAFALINQFAARDRYHIEWGKKKGLSLPYEFLQQVLVKTDWQPKPAPMSVSGDGAISSQGSTVSVDVPLSREKSRRQKRSGKGRLSQNANFDTLIAEDLVNPHWLPMEVQFVAGAGAAETFDIEVEGDHEFIANGLLVHNSAGMRQGDSKDEIFAVAKDNLWQQGEDGNWRIDPERDALRMSNHTRVFHRKPTSEEVIEAVRKQFYSGEGAIQWAGETVARANRDLISTPELKRDFLAAYDRGEGKEWLEKRHPEIETQELEHRLARVGLNPCHAANTLISTDCGLVPIKNLVGQQFKALIDMRSVGLDGVKLTDAIAFATGVQTTYTITLSNGMQMRCTAEHKHLTNRGWVATKDLTGNDKVYIQKGEGHFGKSTISVEQAQMLGWLYGDGSIYQGNKGLDAVFYINQQEYATTFPLLARAVKSLTGYDHQPSLVKSVYTFHSGSPKISQFFDRLGVESKEFLPPSFLQQSKQVIIGFLQGLSCADGTVSIKARRIELVNRYRAVLAVVQLMLLNLGIRSSLMQKKEEGGAGIPYKLKDGTQKISKNNGSWRLLIYRSEAIKFAEIIGFPLSEEKQKKLAQMLDWQSSRNYSAAVRNSWYSASVKKVEEFGEEVVYDLHVPLTHSFIANGCVTHNCGEIIGSNFHCNLSEIHLNQIDPNNHKEQEEAFTAGALSVATLLNHQFVVPRYRYSREQDPIVGVSFTGLFDFFVKAFGVEWLRWLAEGRPHTAKGLDFLEREAGYLSRWRDIVHRAVWDYCDRHGMKRPNRCTTVQPSGTKSLLTNASPGWHPPFGLRWVRRITFAKNDPVALACLDYGYSVVPGQSDKDENGNLLKDPFDDRVKEWLVEIPVEVSWIDVPGVEEIAIEKFTATTMFDYYMQVQKHWTTHNSSATILLGEDEIEPLGDRIYKAIRDDEGYISAALLARFDAPFPRLPFERISREKYEEMRENMLRRQKSDNFSELLNARVLESMLPEMGPQDAACSGMTCELKGSEPS